MNDKAFAFVTQMALLIIALSIVLGYHQPIVRLPHIVYDFVAVFCAWVAGLMHGVYNT
jgi:hypothetical protein